MPSRLIEIIRAKSRPLAPIGTDAALRLPAGLGSIRAVLFDIYGTLFISGSGDISLAVEVDAEAQMREALTASGLELRCDDHRFQEAFLNRIRSERSRMQEGGVAYPEVDIREIWSGLLIDSRERGMIDGELSADEIEQLAITYECVVNPIWPMPGAAETLRRLAGAGVQLGIVSNAQFFTPLLFDALLNVSVADFGFRPDLCAWSYQARRGKPDPVLFQAPAERLFASGIRPEEILVVGNDMLNDISAAARCGLRTALFAGDKRSLRLRAEHPDCRDLSPTMVITELGQLEAVV